MQPENDHTEDWLREYFRREVPTQWPPRQLASPPPQSQTRQEKPTPAAVAASALSPHLALALAMLLLVGLCWLGQSAVSPFPTPGNHSDKDPLRDGRAELPKELPKE